jgi:putative tryptophan/tyrosine transport system substrate-binding protein
VREHLVDCSRDRRLGTRVNRRHVILGVGSATAAWPLAALAQQQSIPVLGFLSGRSPGESASAIAAFRQGLADVGYTEGKNVTIEYHWAEGQYDRLPAIAAELASSHVAVVAATGGSELAAKEATTSIPIVFTTGGDPVELGLVASLNEPGGNVTGVTFLASDLGSKRLGLLREFVANATAIAMLMNPNYHATVAEVRDVRVAGDALGVQINVLNASTSREIDTAFATLGRERPDALFVGGDPFLLGQRDQIVSLAAHHTLPAIYPQREYVDAGGLMSYGTSVANGYRQAGTYTGKVLAGAKPAALPVLQPTKLDLVINLKTAKALNLAMPNVLLVAADELIE